MAPMAAGGWLRFSKIAQARQNSVTDILDSCTCHSLASHTARTDIFENESWALRLRDSGVQL